MKKTRATVVITSAVLCAVMLFSAIGAFAWFALNNFIDPNLEKSTIVTSYFHTGRGTEEDPFVITRPIHFYNLVELYQRKDGFAESGYYFQLGYDLSGDGELLFYNYNDSGEQIETPGEEYSCELNMQYYSGANALLPIGTSDVPFDATFDGSGLTVKNLYIKARETVGENTFGTADVGIWGYVGPGAEIKDVYFSNVTLDLRNTDPSRTIESHNTDAHDTDGDSDADTVYVGYIAGHIFIQSSVTNVYVNNCTVVGGDAAFSGYGYFGYVENKTGNPVPTLGSEVKTLRAAGDDAGFGGSLDLKSVFTRLNNMFTSPATTVRNVTSEEIWTDEVTGGTSIKNRTYANANATASGYNGETLYYYSGEADGSYYMFKRNSGTSWTAIYLYGENGLLNTKTVDYYTLLKDDGTGTYKKSDGILIYSGANYLYKSGGSSVGNNSQSGASVWIIDESGHIYTRDVLKTDETGNKYVDNTGSKYYLNASDLGALSLSQTASTVWTYDPDNGLITYTTPDQRVWYLRYDNGWSAYPFSTSMTVSNGTHYLGTGTSAALEGTSAANAHWILENGKLMTFFSGRFYYLNANGGNLSITTGAATSNWTRDGNGSLSYTDAGGREWYLCYDGGWKCVPFTESFTVSNESNYFSYNGSAFVSSAQTGALHLSLEGGRLVTVYNGTLYYIGVSGTSLTLLSSAPSISWTVSGGNVSYTDAGGRTWYLRYNNGTWDLFPSLTSYTIRSGSDYFGVSGTSLSLTNAAGATNWLTDGSKIYTLINGSIYYLAGSTDGSGAISLTTDRASGTDWSYTQSGGAMSYTSGGATWYLYKINGSFKVFPSASVRYIYQNGYYLSATGAATVGQTAAQASASFWLTDAAGHVYTYYNGAIRYLASNGANVTLSGTGDTVWNLPGGSGTVTNASGWYLVHDNGWIMLPSLTYTIITDGTNYLARNGTTGVTNQTSEANATRWYGDGNGRLFTVDGANVYYLRATTTVLSANTNGAQSGYVYNFNYDSANDRLSFTSGGATYYVVYDSGWKVKDSYERGVYITVTSGATTYYLNRNEYGVSTGTDRGTATAWTRSGNTFYTAVGGTNYYLRAALETNNLRSSTNLTTTTTAGQATSFGYSSNRLTCTLANATYSLALDNRELKMVNTAKTYYTISYGSNYLSLNGTNITNSDGAAAALWEFSNPTSGNTNTTVSSLYNGNTTRYLHVTRSGRNNNYTYTLDFTTDSQNWRYNNNNRLNNRSYTSYYLYYNNGWTTSTSTQSLTRDPLTFTAATVTLTDADFQTIEQTTSFTANTTVSTVDRLSDITFSEATGYAAHTFASVTEAVRNTFTDVVEAVTVSSARDEIRYLTYSRSTGVDSGYPTYFPLRLSKSGEEDYDANDPLKVSAKNTGYIISGGNFYDSSLSGTKVGDIRISSYAKSNVNGSYTSSGLHCSKIGYGNNYLYLKRYNGQYIIASTTDADTANYWYFEGNKLFTAVGGKMYYLTNNNGLAVVSELPGTVWSYNNYTLSCGGSYLRFNGTEWTMGASQSLTLSLGGLDTVYTYNGQSIVALPEDQKTAVYYLASLRLIQILNESTDVYGLHFMNAEISTDHITTAGYANILGEEFYDYEMPEDSIDFSVIERGTISFFAGEYFSNNNAFFSLHQVFRYTGDDDAVINGVKKAGDIKAIKEIVEVYQHSEQLGSANYIYKFKDNTYSNADGTYTGATRLADGYVLAFSLSRITAPQGLNSESHRLFYFEIPCNPGEYCLGSVSGRTGAYLIYLDIAANGGEALVTAVSTEGNDIVEAFNVEFRDRADTVERSILQLSVEAPAVVNTNDFSINVTFDPTNVGELYPSGLYTITVVNKTSEELTLYVYLCDNDLDLSNQFPYAYKVRYINETYENGQFFETNSGDTFQVMAGILIPSAGEALEVSYH